MKRKASSSAASTCLVLSLLLTSPLPCFQPKVRAQQNAPQPATLKVNTKNIGGAFELTAETLLYGDVHVYLPDDMAAGDTISGTVVAEPKGSTEEERAKNQDTLAGYVVEVGGQKVPASEGAFTVTIPAASSETKLRIVDSRSGKLLANEPLMVLKTAARVPRPQTITPTDFQLPRIGQQGRAVEIAGPFDGDSSNTFVSWSKNSENLNGGFGLIAESPRKAVIRSSAKATGLLEINLREGNLETKGEYRSVGVRLSAPKTNLLKGERTTVTIMVMGLQGIQQIVPLLLVKGGVVDMEGGDVQLIPIALTALQPDGTFVATRTITGQQAGAFSLTATVIARRFDVCMRDDGVPTTAVLWNTFTGDYVFSHTGGANIRGTGKVAIKGCIITLTHNASDRRVMSTVNQCTNTGTASVETSSPKAKFAIADGSTTDNSCGVSQ